MTEQDVFVEGEIAPAYFEMNLHTTEDLTQLDKLPTEVQRAYYHEFIHYVQNNTTGFGLYYFWHIYERLRILLGSLPTDNSPVEVPLDNEGAERVKERNKVFDRMRGSHKFGPNVAFDLRHEYQIADVEFENDPFLDEQFKGHDVSHIILIYRRPGTGQTMMRFGENFVMEGMTRLAEVRHYGDVAQLQEHPYITAEQLARFVYPHVADDPERLFALCDVSLMHPLPGWAFYQLLTAMRDNAVTFGTAEELYDYGMIYYAKNGWRIPYREQDAMDGIIKSLDNLFHLPQYAETKTWIRTVLEQGHDLRGSDPHFFIKLFRDKPFTGMMDEVWRRMGGPHCINDDSVRKIQMPQVLLAQDPNIADRVYPQRMRMIWQFHEFLLKGHASCGQTKICASSVPDNGVDESCNLSPWVRAWKNPWCVYATSMHQWGLIPRHLVINGQPVDTSLAGKP